MARACIFFKDCDFAILIETHLRKTDKFPSKIGPMRVFRLDGETSELDYPRGGIIVLVREEYDPSQIPWNSSFELLPVEATVAGQKFVVLGHYIRPHINVSTYAEHAKMALSLYLKYKKVNYLFAGDTNLDDEDFLSKSDDGKEYCGAGKREYSKKIIKMWSKVLNLSQVLIKHPRKVSNLDQLWASSKAKTSAKFIDSPIKTDFANHLCNAAEVEILKVVSAYTRYDRPYRMSC